MLTLEQIAENLRVSPDSPLAMEFFKKQILDEKGFKRIGEYYLKPEDAKELESVGPMDEDFLTGVDLSEIKANQKKHKEILSRKLSLDQAYELASSLPSLNKMWKGLVVTTKSFTNSKNEKRIQIFLNGQRKFSYTEGTDLSVVIEDAIFELRDSINRNSPFHKKEDIKSLIELVY